MTPSLIGIELEVGGVLLKFVQTAAETEGRLHVQEARYPARSAAPPLHRHRKQEEHFQVIEGTLLFHIGGAVGGADRSVGPGGEITIRPGLEHCAYNPGDLPAMAVWETRPALRTAEFFRAMEHASHGRARPPLAEAAAILSEYRDEFELAKPAPFIQRVVFGCLAPFGRRALQLATP